MDIDKVLGVFGKELIMDIFIPGAIVAFDLFMFLSLIPNTVLNMITSNNVIFLIVFFLSSVVIGRIQDYLIVRLLYRYTIGGIMFAIVKSNPANKRIRAEYGHFRFFINMIPAFILFGIVFPSFIQAPVLQPFFFWSFIGIAFLSLILGTHALYMYFTLEDSK